MPKSSANYRTKMYISLNYNKTLVIETLVRRRLQNVSVTSYNQYNNGEVSVSHVLLS